LRLPGRLSKPPRVYVDAKILNMHDPSLPREAYVGYLVVGEGIHNAKKVQARETDDAEVLAILFAIGELKDKLRRFEIVCDHESVVSEAKREEARNPSQIMEVLRETLRENPSIGLRALQANPAHGILTEYVNMLKSKAVQG
jgi:hypothetical protein